MLSARWAENRDLLARNPEWTAGIETARRVRAVRAYRYLVAEMQAAFGTELVQIGRVY